MITKRNESYGLEEASIVEIKGGNGWPLLHELCEGFGMVVMSLLNSESAAEKYILCAFNLSGGGSSVPEKLSPEFDSLNELENFAMEWKEQVIHKYLFGKNGLLF